MDQCFTDGQLVYDEPGECLCVGWKIEGRLVGSTGPGMPGGVCVQSKVLVVVCWSRVLELGGGQISVPALPLITV